MRRAFSVTEDINNFQKDEFRVNPRYKIAFIFYNICYVAGVSLSLYTRYSHRIHGFWVYIVLFIAATVICFGVTNVAKYRSDFNQKRAARLFFSGESFCLYLRSFYTDTDPGS